MISEHNRIDIKRIFINTEYMYIYMGVTITDEDIVFNRYLASEYQNIVGPKSFALTL